MTTEDLKRIIEGHADVRPITCDIHTGPLTKAEIDAAAIDKARMDTVTHRTRPDGRIG